MKLHKRLPTVEQYRRRKAYDQVYRAVRGADPETRRRLLRLFWPQSNRPEQEKRA